MELKKVYLTYDYINKNKFSVYSTYLIERAIIMLVEDGVNKLVADSKGERSIFAILYIFSRERVAEALAALCNKEIISINYKTKVVTFTPLFKSFLKVMNRSYNLTCVAEQLTECFSQSGNGGECVVKSPKEKIAVLSCADENVFYGLLLPSINLRLVNCDD